MSELLPCPFCGGVPQIGETMGTHYVICANDQCAIGPNAEEYTRGNVIAAWNRRTLSPADTTPLAEPFGAPKWVEQAIIALNEIESEKREDAWFLRRIAVIREALTTPPAEPHAVGSGVQGLVDELERKAAEWVRVAAKDSSGMITLTYPKEDAALLLRVADALRTAPAETREPEWIDQRGDSDCWIACLSSLTGIPLADFPQPPPEPSENAARVDYGNAVRLFLHDQGWRIAVLWNAVPAGYAIAGGPSPRHRDGHAVVVLDGRMVHDPHPSRAGLEEVENYEVLIPLVPHTPEAP